MDALPHKICWDNRSMGMITGVKDVISFDEEKVQVETTMGVVTVEGKNLQVRRLSVEQGEMDLEGELDRFSYSESRGQKSRRFFSRLFQ